MEPHPKKTAWVVGASSGLGAALAVRLANEGYAVALSARRLKLLDELASKHENMEAFPLDVSDFAAVADCAASVINRFGHVNLFVYCAVVGGKNGGMHNALVEGLNVGLLGASAALEPIIKSMQQQKCGHIALIGSPVGFRALPGTGSYGTVKSALHYFAEKLKIELSPSDIDVQVILPGFVDTALTKRNTFPMPFLMSIDEATDRIWRGLQKPKRFKIAFPHRLIWPMRILSALPDGIYHKLMRLLGARISEDKMGKK